MNLIKLTILTSCTALTANAVTILESDFTGRTVSGTTATASFNAAGLTTTGNVNIINTTLGVGTGDFFTTADATDRLAVANNLLSGAFDLDFNTTIGAADILFNSVDLGLVTFSNNGALQGVNNTRPLNYTVDVLDTATGVSLGSTATTSSPGAQMETITIATAPVTLTAGSNVTFRISVANIPGNVAGVNAGFESIAFQGDIIEAIPEPSSTALLALGSLALIRRKRS